MEARPLLVILHDPPELLASPDPRTGKIDLHNTWLVSQSSCTSFESQLTRMKTDVVKTYVDWAIKQGFAVIDVNLPKHITSDDDSGGHEDTQDTEYRTREATHLLSYLWENYIEINEATHVFLMGTNTGHGAIVNFIKSHEVRALERVTKAISFVVDVPFQSCKSATNEDLAKWYWSSSMVFVSDQHNFWQSDYARKLKKRFGRVFESVEESLSDMLIAKVPEITAALLEDTEDWHDEKVLSEDEEMDGITTPDARKHPPIGNFALSPPQQTAHMSPRQSIAASIAGRGGTRTPRTGSPTKLPPMANFAFSPEGQPHRSPGR